MAIDAFLRLLRERYLPSLERRRRKSERRGRSCERGALGQSDEVSEFAARRKFGSGSGPHTAQVTVFTNEGEEVLSTVLRSGNMTEEERALGFPLSTLATHTESRASRQIRLNPGDIMFIEGTKSPRRPCRGAMNRAAKENGAVIIYRWGSEEWIARP